MSSEIAKVAIEAAREAGKFLLDNFGKISEIASKGDRNLATNLDIEAEKMIIAKIKEKFPEHGILAEEQGKENIDRDYVWIIDPLDGTHNFIRNINVFGTSIGVLHKDEFIAGAVYMPVDDEMYAAEKGAGAYKNDKKMSTSSVKDLKECSISFDSSIRYAPEVMLKVLGDLAKEVFNIRMFGSSARSLTYVAEGSLDFAVEFHDRPWDFSGSVCIINEAGGKWCDLRGGPLTHKTIGYIASNPHVFEKVKDLVLSRIK